MVVVSSFVLKLREVHHTRWSHRPKKNLFDISQIFTRFQPVFALKPSSPMECGVSTSLGLSSAEKTKERQHLRTVLLRIYFFKQVTNRPLQPSKNALSAAARAKSLPASFDLETRPNVESLRFFLAVIRGHAAYMVVVVRVHGVKL